LIRIAEELLEREVLDANEVKLIMEGKPLPEKVVLPPNGDGGPQPQAVKADAPPRRIPGLSESGPAPA
jgi:cell division protease FtsH